MALLVEHRPALLRFLAARTGSFEEAEDVWQELWLRLAATETGPIGQPRAYLFRAADNLVIDRQRARLRAAARDGAWDNERADGEATVEMRHDPATPADETLIRQQEIGLLRRAIAALPAGAQRALRLHRLEGKSHAEVALAMGISRSGVEKHMAVAMKHLRSALADCGLPPAATSEDGEQPGRGASPAEDEHGR